MNEENNVVSQQNLSALTEVGTNEKKKIDKSVKIILSIVWLIYLPVAVFIFLMSGMAGDDPNAPAGQVALAILLINGVPLLLMGTLTYFIIKKDSLLNKISSNRIFFWIFVFLVASSAIQWLISWVFHIM